MVKVGEIMTTDIVSVAPDTPFKEVVERLIHGDVGSVPVVDQGGKVVGLITEADLICKEAYGDRRRGLSLLMDALSARDHHWAIKAGASVAADLMTRNVVGCRSDEDVKAVARRMLDLGLKRMPVVDAGNLVGIISRHDILEMFARPDDAIARDVERVLSNRNMPDDHHVTYSLADGVVTLTGDVRYKWDAPIVVSMVRSVPGVVNVLSRLHHRESNPRTSSSQWVFGPR
jgi:CBS domain-containing protein